MGVRIVSGFRLGGCCPLWRAIVSRWEAPALCGNRLPSGNTVKLYATVSSTPAGVDDLTFDDEQRSLNKSPLDDQALLSGEFWGELRTFLAVAKTKSFNRAAEITNASQPRVKSAGEAPAGCGRFAAVHLDRARGEADPKRRGAGAGAVQPRSYTLSTSDLKAESSEAKGIVRVSITDGLNILFAAPSLERFSEEYPKIQVHLKSPLNILNLRENQTDMMIGFGPIESSDIQFRKLGQLHFIPVCTKDYIRKHGLPTRDNMEQHVFLQSEYYLAKTGMWDSWQQAAARGRIAAL